MKRYDIKIVKWHENDIVIIMSTSHLSPLKYLSEIELALREITNTGITVVFDLFLSSITDNNRFVKAYFDGQMFARQSFELLKVEKGDYLRVFSANYYRDSSNEVDFTLKSKLQKRMIMNGIPI